MKKIFLKCINFNCKEFEKTIEINTSQENKNPVYFCKKCGKLMIEFFPKPIIKITGSM